MSEALDVLPELHKHRCMRCHQTFACRTPEFCAAQYDVLPNVVTIGAHGPVVTAHCEQIDGVWQPVEAFRRPTDL